MAVYGVAKDSGLGGGKRAMESMDRRALRLHGEYPFGFPTDRSRRCRHLGNCCKDVFMI